MPPLPPVCMPRRAQPRWPLCRQHVFAMLAPCKCHPCLLTAHAWHISSLHLPACTRSEGNAELVEQPVVDMVSSILEESLGEEEEEEGGDSLGEDATQRLLGYLTSSAAEANPAAARWARCCARSCMRGRSGFWPGCSCGACGQTLQGWLAAMHCFFLALPCTSQQQALHFMHCHTTCIVMTLAAAGVALYDGWLLYVLQPQPSTVSLLCLSLPSCNAGLPPQ